MTYPPSITLPYRVANAWLEEQILAGNIVDRYQEFVLEPDKLDADNRERAVTVWKRVQPHGHSVEVLGSAITPKDFFPKGTQSLPDHTASGPIEERIGLQPELPEPTEDPLVVLEAYERWIGRYLDLSGMALAVWIDEMATDEDVDDNDRALGLDPGWWQREIVWKLSEQAPRKTLIDGRKELELFQRARGARQLIDRAADTTDKEAVRAAMEVVGQRLELAKRPASNEELVAAYEDFCERLSNLALAHFWARQQRRDNFNRQMALWAMDHGSERLRVGIADGYRMVPVYLNERITREVPGFYAYLPRQGEKGRYQPRTGPSAPALQLRRAVQQRLAQYTQEGETTPTASIVWMKDPPNEMCDMDQRNVRDTFGNVVGHYTEPFEAIVVEDWLGRYTLMAASVCEEVVPPAYVVDQYLLKGTDYGLEGLPVRTDEDLGDFGGFAPARPRIYVSTAADDDIPF